MNIADAGQSVPNPPLNLLGRRIAFSTLVQYGGKLVQMVLAMLTLKLISNFLSAGDYGVYAKITEYALFFSTIANLGIFGNLVRVMADRPRDGSIFINALLLRLATGLAFFIPAVLFILPGGDSTFIYGTLLFFGALFFDYITSVCDGMLQANYLMGRATVALVAGRVVNFGATFLLTRQMLDPSAASSASLLFAATFAGSIVTALFSIYFVRSRLVWSLKPDFPLMMRLFTAGLPFGIINIINNLYFRFLPDYFAQSALTEEQFGSFNVSFRIAQVASLFSTFLMFSVLPGFKEYLDGKHWQKARVLLDRVWKILLGAGVLLVVGGSFFGGVAIEMLTHKKFILPELWFMLPMMLLLAAVSYGYDLILITLFAMEKDIWLIKREFIALSIAGLILAASTLFPDQQLKIGLIILSALAAESFMVVSGLVRIGKSWD
jgi:O-antigen/teichoic acid export membrane protein